MLNSLPFNSGICEAINLKSNKDGIPLPLRDEVTVEILMIFPSKKYTFLSNKGSPDILCKKQVPKSL